MVQVYSSPNITDITFIQYLLDEAEINFFISDVQTSNILPHLAGAIGGIKIMVDIKDYEVVDKLIKENLHKNDKPVEELVYTKSEDLMCPKCGSADIEETRKPRPVLSIIVSFIFFFPFPIRKKYYQCRECNAFWNKKDISPVKLLVAIIIIMIVVYILIKVI